MNERTIIKAALMGVVTGILYNWWWNGGWFCWLLSLLVGGAFSVLIYYVWLEEKYKFIASQSARSFYWGQGAITYLAVFLMIMLFIVWLTGYPVILPLVLGVILGIFAVAGLLDNSKVTPEPDSDN